MISSFDLTLEIPDVFEPRKRGSEPRFRGSFSEKVKISGVIFKKFWGLTKIFFWCSEWLGGSSTSPKMVEICWHRPLSISSTWKQLIPGSENQHIGGIIIKEVKQWKKVIIIMKHQILRQKPTRNWGMNAFWRVFSFFDVNNEKKNSEIYWDKENERK